MIPRPGRGGEFTQPNIYLLAESYIICSLRFSSMLEQSRAIDAIYAGSLAGSDFHYNVMNSAEFPDLQSATAYEGTPVHVPP